MAYRLDDRESPSLLFVIHLLQTFQMQFVKHLYKLWQDMIFEPLILIQNVLIGRLLVFVQDARKQIWPAYEDEHAFSTFICRTSNKHIIVSGCL